MTIRIEWEETWKYSIKKRVHSIPIQPLNPLIYRQKAKNLNAQTTQIRISSGSLSSKSTALQALTAYTLWPALGLIYLILEVIRHANLRGVIHFRRFTPKKPATRNSPQRS